MSSLPKSTTSPKSRPCPQACGFSLHEKDFHEACPVCLGIVHARRALVQPDDCAHCRQLRRATLERRVKFVEKILGRAVPAQDPLLSSVAEGQADLEGELESNAVVSWADHMEELSELELASPPEDTQHHASATQNDDEDLFDLGLDEHGLSDEEQGVLPSSQVPSPVCDAQGEPDTSFFSLYRRAAQKLDVAWPSPSPAQRPTRFAGFFLPQAPAAVKQTLPLFPDFVLELTSSWSKPLSTRTSIPGFAQFLELEEAEKSGLLSPPPMEPSLAAYLAPSQNHGIAGPTSLPSKHCRFSYAQLEKNYRTQATAARALSSASMLQTYQAMSLAELDDLVPDGSPAKELLREIRIATDYSLRMSRCAAVSLGRGMASSVVSMRHLWLTLTDMPDREKAAYLDGPVCPDGLFGQSLDSIQASFDLKKKQAEALRSALPRRDARPRSTGFRQQPRAQPPKRPASASPLPPKPADRVPRQPAWHRPPAHAPPPGPQRSAAMRRQKPASS